MMCLSRRASLFVVAGLLVLPSTAGADVFAVPFLGLKFGGSTSIVDLELAAGKKKLALGASMLKMSSGIVGYEVEFANTSEYFANAELKDLGLGVVKHGSYVTDLTASVVMSLPPGVTGGGLRPYVVLGGGFIHAEAEDSFEAFQVRRTVPAINIGAGATGMLTNNVGLRFDIRQLRSLSNDPSVGLVGRRINYSRFTTGLMLHF
jgi:hypothetical protein